MDVATRLGAKVIFAHPMAGYDTERHLAKKHLTVGKVYTIAGINPDTYSCRVRLVECPGQWFNSVFFDNT